jgi:transposase
MKIIARKPVKINGLNSNELELWIKHNDQRKAAVKCQILIALCNGNSMTEVCKMFNVTRESVRVWRNIVLSNGPQGLLIHSFTGRKSLLTQSLKKILKKIISKSPHVYGYKYPSWTGKVLTLYLEKEHNIVISIRTAQLWIKIIKNQ